MATTKTPIGKVKPLRGVDYWTEQDKQEIRAEVDAAALAANEAADKANAAAQSAETNSTAAEQAATAANDAAGLATTATDAANEAAADATDAATRAEAAITNAQVATGSAAGAATAANSAADAANEAAAKALDAANNSLADAKTYTDEQVAALVNGAPETLNTLSEVADALEANEGVVDALNAAIGNKVDKVSGKGLSTNDYTTAEKTKLSGIATGANAYTLPTASSSTLGGVKTTSTVTSTSGLTACPIISGVPYYKDTNTTYSAATTSANGLMSSSDKTKLNGIATGAEVNQNAFANVKVGSTTIAADTKTDTLTLVAGTNITLTPNASSDSITIASTGGVDTSSDVAWTTPDTSQKLSGLATSILQYCVKNKVCYVFGTLEYGSNMSGSATVCTGLPSSAVAIFAPVAFTKENPNGYPYVAVANGTLQAYFVPANNMGTFNFSYPIA